MSLLEIHGTSNVCSHKWRSERGGGGGGGGGGGKKRKERREQESERTRKNRDDGRMKRKRREQDGERRRKNGKERRGGERPRGGQRRRKGSGEERKRRRWGVLDVNPAETFGFHTPLQLKTSTAEHLLCLAVAAVPPLLLSFSPPPPPLLLSSSPPKPTSLTNHLALAPTKQFYPSLPYRRSLTRVEEEEEERRGGGEGERREEAWGGLNATRRLETYELLCEKRPPCGNESVGLTESPPNTTVSARLLWIIASRIQG